MADIFDEELLAAKRNRLAVNRTFSGRRFAGYLPFFRVGHGSVLEKQEASAEEAGYRRSCDTINFARLCVLFTSFTSSASNKITIVRTLKEDQPLRLLLNLLFYHFNHSEPTYKSQRLKLLDVIYPCNQLNVNALNKTSITIFFLGDISQIVSY